MKKILNNLSYQIVYQVLAICLPLLTSPYISRVIGASGLGVYSYTYSIVNYFTMFAMLGTVNYGSRQIALIKENDKDVKKTFWSIYMFQVMSALLAFIVYVIYLKVCVSEYKIIAIIQAIWIIACLLDVSWFFFGIEEFRITVTRNIVIKLMTFIAVFVFIQDSDDVWIYTAIMAFGTLLNGLALWPFLLKRIGFYLPTMREIMQHVKSNLLLFVPLLGLSVYHIMDKTMLGIVCEYAESGYYYSADKVMSMPLTVIIATGTVMLPKMSELVAKGDTEEENYLFNVSIEGFMLLTIGMAFGISAVAQKFVPIFFGQGYNACISLIYIFSVIMIFKALANIIRNQYLIPHNLEKVYSLSVFAGAIINFGANYLFIVKLDMGAMGACYGTLVAEAVTCMFYVVAISNKTDIVKCLRKNTIYLLLGMIMYIVLNVLSSFLAVSIINLIIEVIVGGFIYLVLCIVYSYKSEKSYLHLFWTKVAKNKK